MAVNVTFAPAGIRFAVPGCRVTLPAETEMRPCPWDPGATGPFLDGLTDAPSLAATCVSSSHRMSGRNWLAFSIACCPSTASNTL